MFVNKNIAVLHATETELLFNFDNGVIAGVTAEAIEFLNELKEGNIDVDKLNGDEREFFEFLQDNDFISKNEFSYEVKPVSAYIHLTNKCNLHCVGCYSLDEKRNKYEDMTTKEIKEVILQLRTGGVENLIFSGGEPLLTKNIIEIVRYAKIDCKFPNLILITNGTIFNKAVLGDLAKYIDTVSVSLDTYCSDGKPFLRDPNIFDKIMRSISWLKETGNNVNILPTIHHLNSKYLEEYVNLSKKLGVTISFSILSACFEGELLNYLPNDEDLQTISQFMKKTDMAIEDSSIVEKFHAENYCGAGKTIISVGTDGNVYPCHMLMYDEFCLGNIRKESLIDILKHSQKLNVFKNLNVDKLSGGCKECPFKYFCGGGCRARSYMKYRNVTTRDPYCVLFKDYYGEMTEEMFK